MRVRLISSQAFSHAAQNHLYNTRHISPAERKFNDGINFQGMSTNWQPIFGILLVKIQVYCIVYKQILLSPYVLQFYAVMRSNCL